jgi:hypothetical protein
MVERSFIHDPTSEDRFTHAKWAREVAAARPPNRAVTKSTLPP